MKLWIDDIRNAPDDTWTVAETVTKAIRILANHMSEIDVISIDHDISYQVEVNGVSRPYPSPETFQAVALFLFSYYAGSDSKRPKVYVHSANPNGAADIQSILKDADIDSEYTPCPPCNRLENETN